MADYPEFQLDPWYNELKAYIDGGDAAKAQKVNWVAEGIDLWHYGNSFAAYTICAHLNYYDRLVTRMNNPVHGNWGVPSTLAADICSFMYGTWTAQVEFDKRIASARVVGAGTWTLNPDINLLPMGVVILECVGNDRGLDGVSTNGGTTAKSRAGFVNALDAMIRLVRARARVENNNAGWTYAGSWTHATGFSGTSGGSISYTSTPGATATITVGGDCDLIVLAVDDSALGVSGSEFLVRVDGSTFTTGTTSNQTRKTQFAGAAGSTGGNYGYGQMAIPIRGLSAGSHTIQIEHTGSNGDILYLDVLLQPRDGSTNPPLQVLVPKTCEYTQAGYDTYIALGGVTASRATDLIYNQLIDDVIARFPAGEISTWDPVEAGFDATIHVGNKDGAHVHLNDRGNAFYADGLFEVINGLPARDGIIRV